MKRDMELVRTILMMVESGEIDGLRVDVPGYDPAVVAEHVQLLMDPEAQLIDGSVLSHLDDGPPSVMIRRLTWAGHEFLDAARNDTVWSRFKIVVKEKGTDPPFAIAQTLLTKIAENYFLT